MQPLHDLLGQIRRLADGEGVSDGDLLRRFAHGGDESAFELLVWRHGEMVLNTCRRILGSLEETEDAFQATFLTLVRKADSIREGGALAGWLHLVARRASLRAIQEYRNRTRHERQGLAVEAITAAGDSGGQEIGGVVEEEVARLPEPMRVVFVLCQLEGHTAAAAAAQLGCPEGTILSRLSRARERLRERLTRRGLAPEPALPRANLSAALVAATLRSAGHFARGQAEGVVSAQVVTLTQGVLRDMFLNKLKGAAAVLALLLIAGLGGVLAYASQAAERAASPRSGEQGEQTVEPAPKKKPLRLATRDKGLVHIQQVIASPDGKLIATSGTRPVIKGPKPEDVIHEDVMLVWESATGKLVHSEVGIGYRMAFSPDGKTLAVVCDDATDTVTLLAVGTWKVRSTLKKHKFVQEVAFTPDSKMLASMSPHESFFNDEGPYSEVKLWDAPTGRELWSLKPAKDEVFISMAFSPNGKTLAVGTSLGKVKLIEVKTGKEEKALPALAKGKIHSTADPLTRVCFAPDGKTVATWMDQFSLGQEQDKVKKSREARGVKLWDLATGKLLRTIELEKEGVFLADFSPDGKTLAVAGSGMSVTLYNPTSGKRQAGFKLTDATAGVVSSLSFSPESKILVVSGGKLKDFRPITKFFSLAEFREAAAPARTRSVTFTPRGGKVVLITGGFEEDRPPDEVTVRDAADLVPAKKE